LTTVSRFVNEKFTIDSWVTLLREKVVVATI
jgi:hypothetical protein